MKLHLGFAFASALALSLVSVPVLAQDTGDTLIPDAELATRHPKWHITYDVRPDGSYVETQEWSQVILKESAIEQAKQASFSFSTSVAKGEVLKAYTIKKSGVRVDVPKNNYQVQINKGNEGDSPIFSDRTDHTVVFPDASVGDTVVLAYRVDNTVPMFPGQFSVAEGFTEYMAMDDVRVTITAPVSLKAKYASSGMTAHDPIEADGKRTLVWEYKNSHAKKWSQEQAGIFRYNELPSLQFSTFETYGDIAKAYGARALPKAAPTPKTRELARSLTAGKSTERERAKSLYDWVSRNITYAGNCIGIGAVVPHDIDVILDNKMGDCKDHATLLQALLASVGIESDQALVNAGDWYDLPDVPVASSVNHVINYIPALDLFVDSTASDIPFGMLPFQLAQKPVLPVGHYREGVTIPSQAQYGHKQHMKTSLKVHEDGTAEGVIHIQLEGNPAVSARTLMRPLQKNQEAELVKSLVASAGYHGSGELTSRESAEELADHYSFDLRVKIEDFIPVQDATGMSIRPAVGSHLPVALFMGDVFSPLPKRDTYCYGGKSIEEYEIEFPSTVSVLSVPKATSIRTALLDYTSTYKLDGNKLAVRRELVDKTPSNICAPEVAGQYVKTANVILKDIKSQILLKAADEIKYSRN